MTLIEWFKALWPVAAILAAFGIRIEVGQALNKQRLQSIEKDIENSDKAAERSVEQLNDRLSRYESQNEKYLSEIRNDIKELLSR